MSNLNHQPAVESVDAILEGGPRDLPAALRTTRTTADCQKIKIPYRGGYEHFVRDADLATYPDQPHLVFRWADRTAIAE
jgi:hypothetical protein